MTTQKIDKIFSGEFAEYFIVKTKAFKEKPIFKIFRYHESGEIQRIGRNAGYLSHATARKLCKYMAVIDGKKNEKVEGEEQYQLMKMLKEFEK